VCAVEYVPSSADDGRDPLPAAAPPGDGLEMMRTRSGRSAPAAATAAGAAPCWIPSPGAVAGGCGLTT
jgi:hypothetical protein